MPNDLAITKAVNYFQYWLGFISIFIFLFWIKRIIFD